MNIDTMATNNFFVYGVIAYGERNSYRRAVGVALGERTCFVHHGVDEGRYVVGEISRVAEFTTGQRD